MSINQGTITIPSQIPPESTDPPAQVRMSTGSSLSWLPVYSGDMSTLSSLAVCYVNLNAGCDSKRERKRNNYLEAWKNPAPQYCRSGAARFTDTVKEEPILTDRLGLHHGAVPMHIPV